MARKIKDGDVVALRDDWPHIECGAGTLGEVRHVSVIPGISYLYVQISEGGMQWPFTDNEVEYVGRL